MMAHRSFCSGPEPNSSYDPVRMEYLFFGTTLRIELCSELSTTSYKVLFQIKREVKHINIVIMEFK